MTRLLRQPTSRPSSAFTQFSIHQWGRGVGGVGGHRTVAALYTKDSRAAHSDVDNNTVAIFSRVDFTLLHTFFEVSCATGEDSGLDYSSIFRFQNLSILTECWNHRSAHLYCRSIRSIRF